MANLAKKVCIFNGLEYHFEMFGYIIDYCKQRNIQLDIYTVYRDRRNDYSDWISFFKNYFNNNFNLYHMSKYNPVNNYDKIVLNTAKDKTFLNQWIDNRVIAIDHLFFNTRPQVFAHIGTRPFFYRPKLDWILPVYRMIDIKTKKTIAKDQIVFVGAGNIPENIKNFLERFPILKQYKLIFISRFIWQNKKLYADFPNAEIFENLDTKELIHIIKSSKYVYISEADKTMRKNMSGIIPYAFNCLCQIIMPERMNLSYKFKSVITYNKKINISEPDYELIDQELSELIKRKFSIFDKYMNKSYCSAIIFWIHKNIRYRSRAFKNKTILCCCKFKNIFKNIFLKSN